MQMSVDDVRHLLVRTGFGASASDALALNGMTRQDAINTIIKGISKAPDVAMPDWVDQPLPHYHATRDMDAASRMQFNKDRNAEIMQLRHWWVLNMLGTTSPQTERLVLFWHDLFATSYQGLNRQTLAMARQNQTFRELGFGQWDQLLKAMIRDAALLEYLDAGSNHKASPNENLARELMELFVLGEGNYTEADVREAARALTGHDTSRFHNLQFRLKTWVQDRKEKTMFGRSGNFDGDDLIALLLAQDAAPRFLATRFWRAFVSDSAPPTDWVDDQARRFRQSGLQIASLYRNVLESEAFWHADQRGAMIKSPVDLVVGTARTLEYPKYHWQKMPNWQSKIGMKLFAPPNVAGWNEGAAFITPGHLLNRFQVMRQLTRNVPADKVLVVDPMDGQSMNTDTVDRQSTNIQSMVRQSTDRQPKRRTSVLSGSSPETAITASALHLQSVRENKNSGKRNLEIVLDHLQTPEKSFHHVRFTIEKKRDEPIMLLLSTYSCWPDCVEDWPECARTDKHFTSARHIVMPWAASGDQRWSDAFDHRCQFDNLNLTEQRLVATLWAELPSMLSQGIQTFRVQNRLKQWLPIIEYLTTEYKQASVNIKSSPYAEHALPLAIGPEHGPSQPAHTKLSARLPRMAGVSQLLAAFDEMNFHPHQLLLPSAVGDVTPGDLKTDSGRPGKYIRAVIENPLFQLK